MKVTARLRIVACVLTGTLGSFALGAQEAQIPLDAGVLEEVRRLYGIDENAAVERLVQEERAADIYMKIRREPPRGYAGAWFDGMVLKVALADNADVERVQALGAEPVQAEFSLEALEAARRHYREHTEAILGREAIRSRYVDYSRNRIVVTASAAALDAARAAVGGAGLDPAAFIVQAGSDEIVLTAALKGATRTRNLTWEDDAPDAVGICSVGVSVVGGFATAGHCGYAGNVFGDAAGTTLGAVEGSTMFSHWSSPYPLFDGGQDSGWVETVAPWSPSPVIEGYAYADVTVPAKLGGVQQYPVGTTVCRYGATSARDCGTIDAINVDIGLLEDITRVSSACSADGDSGGPFIASSSSQVQGTVIGNNGDCGVTGEMYFQPIGPTLAKFDLTMLTAHGPNPPTVSGFTCPDWDSSGGGYFYCTFDHYNAQGGEPSYLWSPSSGPGSTTEHLFGTCTIGHPVSVTLAISSNASTENYGTSYRYANFTCPDDPP